MEYRKKHFISRFIILFALFALLPGCSSDTNPDVVEEILIQVGESTVTVQDFYEAFHSGVAYPSVLYGDKDALHKEKYRTLNRLTEELIIFERARELQIEVSDEELALAVEDFRKDYPDDTFEQTLIENGIPYPTWEKRLKRRLLLEKVVRNEISKNNFPTPLSHDEAAAAHQEKDPEKQVSPENRDADENTDGSDTEDSETPLSAADTGDDAPDQPSPDGGTENSPEPAASGHKAAPEYDNWLNRLKGQYTIEIDWELWEKIDNENAGDASS
jgi:hypothetical protein